jgi:hypothetical protein
MNSWKSGRLALVTALLVAAMQIGYHWQRLPPKVASHFSFQGNADCWMAKTLFVLSEAGLLLGMACVQILLDLLIYRAPPRFFSLPNRDYWLAPERRAETNRVISGYMAWLFVATLLFLTAMYEFCYQVSLGHPDAMRLGMPWLLVVYAGVATVWVRRLFKQFSKPPEG